MKKALVINLFWIFIIGCKAQLGPGYRFELFDSTANSVLAKAVAQEDTNEIQKIVNKGDINVDFKEPKFGRTLLLLAIGNNKIYSTRALLNAGANIGIRDNDNNAPINEASKLFLYQDYSNAYNMLDLLIKHGADVNSEKRSITDSSNYEVPLSNTTNDFRCSKLLLDNGADPNFKKDSTYFVWMRLLFTLDEESIFIIHYIIVKKKMPLPKGVILYGSNGQNFSLYGLINKKEFPNDPKKAKLRQEILDYLDRIGYPKN